MNKDLLKEEDKLDNDLDKIDDNDKESISPEQTEVEKNIVELMISGDEAAVKAAIHKHVVSVVAKSVNDVDNIPDKKEDEPPES